MGEFEVVLIDSKKQKVNLNLNKKQYKNDPINTRKANKKQIDHKQKVTTRQIKSKQTGADTIKEAR